MRVDATFGLFTFMFIILSNLDLFLTLFYLLSSLEELHEEKLSRKTDFLLLSSFFASLKEGFTFSFIILS